MMAALSPTRAGEDDAKFYRPWAAWAAEYGSIYAICFGSSPRLVITDVKLVKEVGPAHLVTDCCCCRSSSHLPLPQLLRAPPHVFPKTPSQRLNLSFLGNGLVNSGGAFWQRQRKLVNPAFSHTNIKVARADSPPPTPPPSSCFLPLAPGRWVPQKMTVGMIESTEEAVEALKQRVPSSDSETEVEMGAVLSLLTLDIIGRTAFGANIGGGSQDAKRVSVALTHLIEGVLELALGGYLLIPFYRWVHR